MSGKRSRAKGHSFEREIAKLLRDTGIFPDAKRHLEYQDGEANGVDISNTGALRIQCKRNKKYCSITKINEIQVPGIHVLVTKGDNVKPMACLYLDDLIAILKDIGVVYAKEESQKEGS